MATEEWIKRAIQNGKQYEDLPPRVRSVLPVNDWKLKCASRPCLSLHDFAKICCMSMLPFLSLKVKDVGCSRVKEHCIIRGFAWDDSLASTSCPEQEYYEDLLRFYRYNNRVRWLSSPALSALCSEPTLNGM